MLKFIFLIFFISSPLCAETVFGPFPTNTSTATTPVPNLPMPPPTAPLIPTTPVVTAPPPPPPAPVVTPINPPPHPCDFVETIRFRYGNNPTAAQQNCTPEMVTTCMTAAIQEVGACPSRVVQLMWQKNANTDVWVNENSQNPNFDVRVFFEFPCRLTVSINRNRSSGTYSVETKAWPTGDPDNGSTIVGMIGVPATTMHMQCMNCHDDGNGRWSNLGFNETIPIVPASTGQNYASNFLSAGAQQCPPPPN